MLLGDTIKVTTAMLASHRLFMRHLRWDVTPESLFKPRFVGKPEDRALAGETEGYMFYIDWYKGKGAPTLMIMKNAGLSSSTFAEVTDCPPELLEAAVRREGVKAYSDMYPIDEAVEAWLKEKLGVTSRG
ncbi:MAG: hypothetical protein P8Y77_08885 [Nitrospirota bacterium]|jgi:hypothetical protein